MKSRAWQRTKAISGPLCGHGAATRAARLQAAAEQLEGRVFLAANPFPGQVQHYWVPDDPWALAAADLDRDGDVDLVTNDWDAVGRIAVLMNNGDGTFAAPVHYAVGDYPVSIVTVDADHDGNVDLAVANSAGDNVSVLLNNGDGTFAAQVTYQVGDTPTSIAVADLDGDGDQDLVTVNIADSDLSILLNNGDGTFAPEYGWPAGIRPFKMSVADLDGDGDTDIVTGNEGNYPISFVCVLLNNGDATFAPAPMYQAGDLPTAVATADFDGDGDVDVAAANRNGNNISILRNNGNGTLAAPANYAAGESPRFIVAADFDGDGDADVLAANYGGNSAGTDVSLLQNNGDGTFAAEVRIAVGRGPSAIVAADLDGDGDIDAAIANYSDDNVAVLGNFTISQPPTAVGLSATTIAENRPSGSIVGAFSATDPDIGDGFTYTLVAGDGSADNGSFTIGGNLLRTAASFDYEAKSSYSIRVAVTDLGGQTYERSFTIGVTQASDGPVLDPIADQTIAENQLLSFTVHTSAPVAGPLTYSLVTGAPAGASIAAGLGIFSWTPTEAQGPGVYTIGIQVSDGSLSYTRSFDVTVTEANAAPALADASFAIPEGQLIGTVVGTLAASDPDLPANSFTYAITAGNEDGRFAINPATGQLTVAGSLDYESCPSYHLTVTATDNGSPALSATATVTIPLTDLQEFGLQQGKLQRATLIDGTDGELITLSLTGGGSGAIQPDGRITLTNTTAKSVLTISVKKSKSGDGYANLQGISSEGPLKSIAAARVDIRGDIAVGTLAGPATLSPLTISLATISDGSINTHGQPITSLKLRSWWDFGIAPSELIAPWIGSISATGDWEADILTSSADRGAAIGSMKVGGSIYQATIWASGTLKSLSARGGLAESRIAAADGIASLTASSLQASDILVGVSQDFAGHYATAFANPAARLGKLTITGEKLPKGEVQLPYVTGSHLSAGSYGTITLTNVPATAIAPILHVAADTGTLKLVCRSADMLPAGTWKATQTPRPGHERPNLVAVVS